MFLAALDPQFPYMTLVAISWLFDMFHMCYIDVKDCINCRGTALAKHCTVCRNFA